jgi:hypothetical protein
VISRVFRSTSTVRLSSSFLSPTEATRSAFTHVRSR